MGTTFELEARLWENSGADRRSIIPSDGYTPKWKDIPDWLELTAQNGFRATFRVKVTPSDNAELKVEADNKVSPPAEILVPLLGAAAQDDLKDAYVAAHPPDVAVVSGDWNFPGPPCVNIVAFVRRAMLGERVKPCTGEPAGWAAVLSTDYGMSSAPVTWTPPPGSDDASPTQQPVLVLPVALRIMVYEPTPSQAELDARRAKVLATAKDDLGKANAILAEARAGIRLQLDPAHIVTGTLNYDFVVKDCFDPGPTADEPGVLTIYYVDQLDTGKGVTCPWHEGRPQESIYVNRHERVWSTLLHEIGHALGLTIPRDGHTEVMREFDLTNIMMCCNVDKDRLARTRITVGQLFRMNADSGSWLNWAKVGGVEARSGPRVRCQCGKQDPEGNCPRLAEDVAAPNTTVEEIDEIDCYDRLEINATSAAGEVPVAIVSGRRWRMPPASPVDKSNCRWVRAQAETESGAVAVRFDNLTRAGTCPSWAAIFFETHRPIYLKLPESEFRWTQVGEARAVNDAVPGPVPLTVNLYYHEGDGPTVGPGGNYLQETFAASSHTGIALTVGQVKVPDGLPLPCPAGSSAVVSICFHTIGGSEGTVSPIDRKIELWLNHHDATSASHFLARLLGLVPITTAELAARPDDYADNLMNEIPAKRGRHLTLGQIYQIHVQLGNVPGCMADPLECPPLYAGRQR